MLNLNFISFEVKHIFFILKNRDVWWGSLSFNPLLSIYAFFYFFLFILNLKSTQIYQKTKKNMSYGFPKANIHQHIKEGCNVIVTWFRGWFFFFLFFSLFHFCCKLLKCELNNLISTKINWIQIKIYCCSFVKKQTQN